MIEDRVGEDTRADRAFSFGMVIFCIFMWIFSMWIMWVERDIFQWFAIPWFIGMSIFFGTQCIGYLSLAGVIK